MQPGGKIERNETAADAVHREVREELGVNLTHARQIGVFSAAAANEPDHVVTATVFVARIEAGPSPSSEIAEMMWLDPNQSNDHQIAPLSRLLLHELRS